jgi:hypothetical protein
MPAKSKPPKRSSRMRKGAPAKHRPGKPSALARPIEPSQEEVSEALKRFDEVASSRTR